MSAREVNAAMKKELQEFRSDRIVLVLVVVVLEDFGCDLS